MVTESVKSSDNRSVSLTIRISEDVLPLRLRSQGLRRLCCVEWQSDIDRTELALVMEQRSIGVDAKPSRAVAVGSIAVMCAVLVPNEAKQRPMIGEVFDGEVRPIARHKWLEHQGIAERRYNTE